MKIIFLDIDGVLNSWESYKEHNTLWTLSKDHVFQLNRIIEATGAKIVISSSWRNCKEIKDNLNDYLINDCGVKGEIIGKTPLVGFNRRRGLEIKAWLDEWQGEPIEQFVILDDDSDMIPLMDRLCKTNIQVGLTEEKADEAIRMLNE